MWRIVYMIILQMIAIWFYYSFWFILISFCITLVFNRFLKKLWLSPMVINVIALAVLVLDIFQRGQGQGFLEKFNWYLQSDYALNIWMYYLPVVFISILTNIIIQMIRIIKRRLKGR